MPRRAASRASGEDESGSSSAIDKIKSQEPKYHDKEESLRGAIMDCAKSLGGLPISEAAKKAAAESMLKTMDEALEVKFMINDFMRALGDLGPATVNVDISGLVDVYEAKIDEAMAAQSDENRIKTDAQRQRYENIVAPILGGQEDDDCMVDDSQEVITEAALKDSLSQKIFENPMRSVKCQHVYSRSSVEEYFKCAKVCIMPGCSHSLTKADFERDIETELALKRFKAQQERNQESAPEGIVL